MLKIITCCIISLFIIFQNTLFAQSGENNTLTVDSLKSDLQFLRKTFESKHPTLYLYTPKNELDKVFDSLSSTLVYPLTELEFYKRVSFLCSVIKDGHTNILPGSEISNIHLTQSKFIPYHVIVSGNKILVDQVLTNENAIKSGTEILSINNISSAQIIRELEMRLPRDGYNQTYPFWILSNFFKDYYSFSFGHPEEYTIEYKQKDVPGKITVDGILNERISYYSKINYPQNENKLKPGTGITLHFSEDNIYAILKIRDFHKNILKKEYKQNFKKTIRDYFVMIQSKNVPNLILDLRDNQGGELAYGKLLLSYLIDRPFILVDSYYKVKPSSGQYELKKTGGPFTGKQKPMKNCFKGNITVLINGGSFSNSGIVSSCLKRYTKATFVGEETGGNNKVLAGYLKEYTLPFSKIQVQIPARQFLLDGNLTLTGHGTIPDLPMPQDPFSDTPDPVLKYVTDKITNGK